MNPRRGASMLEVIFAASLLAIVFMVLLSVLPSSLFALRKGEHRAQALALAMGVLQECRSGPFSRLQSDGVFTPLSGPPLGPLLQRHMPVSSDGMQYEVELQIGNPGAGLPRNLLALARVRVRWNEPRGGPQLLERSLEIARQQR